MTDVAAPVSRPFCYSNRCRRWNQVALSAATAATKSLLDMFVLKQRPCSSCLMTALNKLRDKRIGKQFEPRKPCLDIRP